MSDIYHAMKKEYPEWEPMEDERIRLGNHVPDGYTLNVPAQDVERLTSNLNNEADRIGDTVQVKLNEIKALLFDLMTGGAPFGNTSEVCSLELKINDLAMLNRQIGSVHEQQSRMPGYWEEEE